MLDPWPEAMQVSQTPKHSCMIRVAHMQHISETVNEKLRCKHIHAGHVEGFSGDEWKQNLQTNQERRARPHLTDETAPEDRREGCKGGHRKLKCGRAEMHDASKAFTTAADERVFLKVFIGNFSLSLALKSPALRLRPLQH